MTLYRIQRTASQVLARTFFVDDETPTDATVGVVVTVRRLDGTVIASGAASHPVVGSGEYFYTYSGSSTLDTLAVEWVATLVGGVAVTERDYIEVVGGFLFGLAEVRAERPVLDEIKFPTAELRRRRIQVEDECFRICGQAFTPRFARIVLSGNDRSMLVLPWGNVRVLRAVTVGGVALSAGELAVTYVKEAGVLDRGYGSWPYGWNNVVAEIEYGMDYPPEDLRDAGKERLRSLLNKPTSSVPERAITWSVDGGGTYRIMQPTREKTGLPNVDATYGKWTLELGGFA